MNPLLAKLQPYPFERLKQLFASVTPNPALRHISLGIGEPKHATPAFIQETLKASVANGLSAYPATAGEPSLRKACATWLQTRYNLALDPLTQVLPVNGSREALFALTADRDRPDAARCHGGQSQPLLSNLRRRSLVVGRSAVLRAQRPSPQLCQRLGQRAHRGLGTHAIAVRLLAG